MNNIKYYRYVDDILILANQSDLKDIKEEIEADIRALDLELSNNKCGSGSVVNGFEYLGYKFNQGRVSVRESSILKLEQSVEELFKKLNGDNNHYIEWKLNLKITGFVWNQHKYGWLFFYSQITDMTILFHLDHLVKKFYERYHGNERLSNTLRVKRFVKSYMEIKNALHKTKYIPNIDKYTIEHKKEILTNIYAIDLTHTTERYIEFAFSKIMRREIRDIERDIQHFS